jgi:hypothetical protein
METVIVRLKHAGAKKLLLELEALELIELKLDSSAPETISTSISDLKNMMKKPLDGESIDEQLKKLRNEWERNT